MRLRGWRPPGVLTLLLSFALALPACSSQQQDEEGLETSQNEAGDEMGNQTADNAVNESGGEENDVGNENANVAENSTENDLQEIITEMNNQPAAGAGDLAATEPPLQAEPNPAMNAAAPMPMNEAAAAPVANAAPTPAPTAAAAPAIPFQPGGTPAGQGLPEVGSKMAYIVQKGDTLGKISTKIYGSPARWNEISKLSGISNPNRLYPGDVVYYTLDESAVAFASAYESIQRSEEQVQPGDTLATISQRLYGSTTHWRVIWRQNGGIDNPDILPPGSTVYYITQSAMMAALATAKTEQSKLAKLKTNSDKIAKSNKSSKAPRLNGTIVDSVPTLDHGNSLDQLDNASHLLVGKQLAANLTTGFFNALTATVAII